MEAMAWRRMKRAASRELLAQIADRRAASRRLSLACEHCRLPQAALARRARARQVGVENDLGAAAPGVRASAAISSAKPRDMITITSTGIGVASASGPASFAAMAFWHMLLQMGVDQKRKRVGIEAACTHQGIEQPARAPHARRACGAMAFDFRGRRRSARPDCARAWRHSWRSGLGAARLPRIGGEIARMARVGLARDEQKIDRGRCGSGASMISKPAASIMRVSVRAEK